MAHGIRNTSTTLTPPDGGRLLFEKTWPRGSCGPVSGGTLVTPFRNVIEPESPSDTICDEGAFMKKHNTEHGLPIIDARAAGIDIGSRFHVVAVPIALAEEPVQTFQAFTADLERMATWLVELGITTVAMESTGMYWIPVYEILETHGLQVILANARDA